MLSALLSFLGLGPTGCNGPNASSPPRSADLDRVVEQSLAHLEALTLGHGLWINSIDQWGLDQDTGVIVFQCSNGMTASAEAQVIGTYNTLDGTWLWAWDNPSIVKSLQNHAIMVTDYGRKHHHPLLTERKSSGTEDDAWGVAALAAFLNKAQGVYRCPAGDTYVFVTFGEVRLGTQTDAAD